MVPMLREKASSSLFAKCSKTLREVHGLHCCIEGELLETLIYARIQKRRAVSTPQHKAIVHSKRCRLDGFHSHVIHFIHALLDLLGVPQMLRAATQSLMHLSLE